MTENPEASVLTATRAAQHFRLFRANDAYEHLCVLTLLPSLEPLSTLCWQIHRGLTVSVPLLRMWVHCPRASNGLLPRRSNLVGYVRWDAQSDPFPPCQTIIPTAFRSQSGLPTIRPEILSATSQRAISGLRLRLLSPFGAMWSSRLYFRLGSFSCSIITCDQNVPEAMT